MESNPLKFICR